MNPQPAHHTAAQLAAVTGLSPRAVRARLDASAASTVMVCGQKTLAWPIEALPESWRLSLVRSFNVRLGGGEIPLECVNLGELHPEIIESTEMLSKALAPSIARKDDPSLSATELKARGVEDYARVFGHTITPRYWHELFRRTLARDAGNEDFGRLALYLPNQLKRKADALPAFSSAAGEEFRELHGVMATFRQPASPTRAEESLLWLRAFELLESLVADGKAEKKLRGRLLKFLWKHAPWLAASPNALRVMFDRKLRRWREQGRAPAALVDKREAKRGEAKAPAYDPASLDRLTWHTVANCGGRISQGVRELVQQGALTPDISDHYLRQPASKSYVPERLRAAVRADVKAQGPFHQGPRAAEKMLPSLDLDYEGVFSLDAIQADDFTMPVAFAVPDGRGWFTLTRGQVLLAIDWRTLRVLGFCLYPEGQYNSGLIRTLFTRVFDEHGLPKKLYLERGIWQTSKLITGGVANVRAERAASGDGLPFSWAEVEMGLRQFGIDFTHARRARSKPVERVGGLLQDLMHGEPMYCGRDERRDCPEITTRHKRLVESRQAEPAALGIYTAAQWEERLQALCARFNATPQDGKRLAGLSPDEAFARFWNHEDKPSKFDASCRYLLAHHRIPVEVKIGESKTGLISFQVRGERFRYCDAQTGERLGQKLLAWFNPEAPESCTFTDANLRNAFTVERLNSTNGLFADDSFEDGTRKVHAALAYTKARYRVLKASFGQTFRQNLVSGRTVELGAHIEQTNDKQHQREQATRQRVASIRRQASALNIPTAVISDDAQTAEGLARLQRASLALAAGDEAESPTNEA
jgi:hypothetical protein